jgi:hypothetical protein
VTTELVSDPVFRGFISAMTGGVAGFYGVVDAIRFARMCRADGRDPVVHDKRFGYAIGVAVGLVGVIGTLRFNGVM